MYRPKNTAVLVQTIYHPNAASKVIHYQLLSNLAGKSMECVKSHRGKKLF